MDKEKKTLGVVGLGLIGGSFVKAYEQSDEWQIYGYDVDDKINQFALLAEDIDGVLTDDRIGECDLILICVYPEAAVRWLAEHAEQIADDALVIDCCGVKKSVCAPCFEIAKDYKFTYVGGHPMAGRHYSGYKYATEKLYRGAPMVIVPGTYDDIELFDRVKRMLQPAGFGSISVTTAEDHDRMIAFTSQLPHVLACSYVMSPSCPNHKGFSAGSYRDVSRVANINSKLWSELFLENREPLIEELDILLQNIGKIVDAVKQNDRDKLANLLEEGHKVKQLLGE